MGTAGFILLLVGALVLGLIAQFLGQARFGYDWLITAIGAAIGGFVASEWLGGASTWGPEADGLFVLPALIGAVIVGALVEYAVRRLSSRPRLTAQQ